MSVKLRQELLLSRISTVSSYWSSYHQDNLRENKCYVSFNKPGSVYKEVALKVGST